VSDSVCFFCQCIYYFKAKNTAKKKLSNASHGGMSEGGDTRIDMPSTAMEGGQNNFHEGGSQTVSRGEFE